MSDPCCKPAASRKDESPESSSCSKKESAASCCGPAASTKSEKPQSCCRPAPSSATKSAYDIHESVSDYYGKVLTTSTDLKTNACCTSDDAIPKFVKECMSLLSNEVMAKYYGCGIVIPPGLEGLRVLDLGCGAGRDVFILSKLVGESGSVVGVDMTPEQLEVANNNIDFHTKSFGFKKSNVTFLHGYIEKLQDLGLEPGTFDLIVSNCVVNLCADKEAVLRGAHQLLKEGGEMYFSDVYAGARIPQDLATDPVLLGECLGGALYWRDFYSCSHRAGFPDVRLYEKSVLEIQNKEVERKIGHVAFHSATFRLFKVAGLDDGQEDYGQAVAYKGTMQDNPRKFSLDEKNMFVVGKITGVSKNTASILKSSRLSKHFIFYGSEDLHYGAW